MPVRDDILAPIPGDNPAGVDLIGSGDTAISEIREARKEDTGTRREDDPPARVADWPRVLKLANETLATRSKDLEVAGYLAEALLKREGLAGFRAGLGVMKGLLEHYWDTLHPALEESPGEPPWEARVSKLEWFGARYPRLGIRSSRSKVSRGYLHAHFQLVPLCKAGHGLLKYNEARDVGLESDADNAKKSEQREERIKEGKLTMEEWERAISDPANDKTFYKALKSEVTQTVAALDALKQVTRERFGGANSREGGVWDYDALTDELKDITEVVDGILAKKLEADPDPVEMAPEPEAVADGAPGAASADESPWSEPRNADEAGKRVALLAEFLRKASPTNPGPYLMLRGLRWGELRAGGATVDPKLLIPPPTAVRSQLKSFSLDGRWKDLLEQGERVMARPDGRGWLDLQRHVVTACDKLGSDYERVGSAIRGELALLLRDLPSLPDMTLMDDTPTANAETRQWLRDQGLMNLALDISEEARAATATPARPRESGDAAYERAMEATRSGSPQRGVELLMAEAQRERSPRGRFLRMTQVAAIMVEADMKTQAFPILDQLVDTINNDTRLVDWENGETVAQPLALLYACLPADSDRRDSLYQLVCRLDPVRGMGLG